MHHGVTGPPTLDPDADPRGPKRWHVGTLTYTRPQLTGVFFWLLWGDFCLALMDNGVATQAVNLQLKKLGASNAAIGFLNGTVMSIMSALLVTIVSTASDRTRTRLGRRMPYLLWATPPLAVFLIGIGYSAQLAHWLHGVWPWGAVALTRCAALLPGIGQLPGQAALVIGVMTVMITLYKLCDLFPQSVYYYLWADVVPAKLMGGFVCLFRIVAAVGLFIFERYVLKYADTHPEYIYIGAGLLYMVSFIAMSLIVKEGQYPPPAPPKRKDRSLIAGSYITAASYLRECFSHSYYVKFYAMNCAFILAIKSLSQFLIIYGTQGLGLSTARYGQIVSWKNPATIVPILLIALIVDRFHPIRIGIVTSIVVLGTAIASFFLIRGETTFMILTIALYSSIAIYQAGTGALLVRLLPRDQYGQFASANALVFNLGWAAASPLCGAFLDRVTGMQAGQPTHPENYRYLFLWFAALAAIGVWLSIDVYYHWKRLGGDDSYVAPTIATIALTETTARGS